MKWQVQPSSNASVVPGRGIRSIDVSGEVVRIDGSFLRYGRGLVAAELFMVCQRRPRKLENDLRRPVVIDVDQFTVADAQAGICGGTASEQAAFGLVCAIAQCGAALRLEGCSLRSGGGSPSCRQSLPCSSASVSALWSSTEAMQAPPPGLGSIPALLPI